MDGFIVLYSTTDKNSFLGVDKGVEEILKFKDYDFNMVLCGTKCDLLDMREVATEEGLQLADTYECQFIENSAKEDINVDESFQMLIEEIYKSRKEAELQGGKDLTKRQTLRNLHAQQKRGVCW